VDEDDPTQERQLNIQIAEEHLSGVYANFANISFSDYEFTVTFARIDHEIQEGDIIECFTSQTVSRVSAN